MSGGGGGSGNDSGGSDMQVSGMEAAYSNEKGISTAADTRVSNTSFSRGNDEIRGNNEIDHADSQGNIVTTTIGYGEGQVDPKLAEARLGADTSTVGIAARAPYSNSEIEKGYTDTGEKLSQVGAGKYMTKQEMYNTGIIERGMVDGVQSGEDVQGRVQVNPNTGELERTDMTFSEHWKNAPKALIASPTLRFLYASGKNVGEWASKKGFEGYSEAGKRPNDFLGNLSDGSSSNTTSPFNTGGSERDMMNALAPEAPYIVSGITKPNSSPAADWYANLGKSNTNQHNTDIATQYAAAKTAVSKTLQNKGPIGMLAVNDSPYYDWLKTNKLDKGIL
jgi:hypothetical protein